MGIKAVFLDRDGVITVDRGYTHRVEDLDFIPNAIEGLRALQLNGYELFVVTNQGGIGLGLFTEEDFLMFTKYMLKELHKQGVDIRKVYYCPHREDAIVEKYRRDCSCRKPNNGMLLRAIKDFDIDLQRSWMVGDKSSDIEAGKKTKVRTVLVLTGDGMQFIHGASLGKETADFVVKDLYEAASVIIKHDDYSYW